MISNATVVVSILLLSLGIVSIALAVVAAVYSVSGGRQRTAAMAVLGIGALVGMVYMLWGQSWDAIWEDMVWPLLVLTAAAAAGLATGAGLIYGLVAVR